VTSPDQVTGMAREETSAVAGTAAEETKAVAGTVKDQAGAVASTTAQAAGEVKDTAKEQAGVVADETKQQVGNVVNELRGQVSAQSEVQTRRAVGGLRSIADQVRDLAEGKSPQSGQVADFLRQVADRVQRVAGQVESQGPAGLFEQARDFARRRPGGFLASAALAGAAAGRMVKGASAGGSSDSPSTYRPETMSPTGTDTTTTTPSYDYGTGAGTPLQADPSDSFYVQPTGDALPYSAEYGDPNPTAVDYETDPAYRSGSAGSDAGRI